MIRRVDIHTIITVTVLTASIFLLLVALALNPWSSFFANAIQNNPQAYVFGPPQTLAATHEIMVYLWIGKSYSLELSPQAKAHMADVRSLFVAGQITLIVCIWLAAILLRSQTTSHRRVLLCISCAAVGTLTLMMGLLAAIGFDTVFIAFHHLFFRNDLWLFPPTDSLVQYFPAYFFQQVALQVGLWIVIVSAGIVAICQLASRNSA